MTALIKQKPLPGIRIKYLFLVSKNDSRLCHSSLNVCTCGSCLEEVKRNQIECKIIYNQFDLIWYF